MAEKEAVAGRFLAWPVFWLETLVAGRRSRLHAFRRVLAGWLILQFCLFALMQVWAADPAQALDSYFRFFSVEHFLLLFIATPALVAGTITDEKSRGTIPYLLTTDLRAHEIVLEKLAARAVVLASIAVVELPLLGILAGYGQRGPGLFIAFLALTALVIFTFGSVSIWMSVCRRRTPDAMVRTYVLFALAALVIWGGLRWGIPYVDGRLSKNSPYKPTLRQSAEVLRSLNPVYAFQSAWQENNLNGFASRFVTMLPWYAGTGAVCFGLTVWRLRPRLLRTV